MFSYDNPKIITNFLTSPIAMSQYGFGQTPSCGTNNGSETSSSSCGSECLGPVACNDGDPDSVTINFFLPESEAGHTPEFCVIKARTGNDVSPASQSQTGTNCHYQLLSDCSDGSGAVWQITCDFSNGNQAPGSFCDAEEYDVDCGGGTHVCNTLDLRPCSDA